MSLDKLVLIPLTFMFSLKENESCCIAEDANALRTGLGLDSGDRGSHRPYSLRIFSILSLSLSFFLGKALLGTQLHARSYIRRGERINMFSWLLSA